MATLAPAARSAIQNARGTSRAPADAPSPDVCEVMSWRARAPGAETILLRLAAFSLCQAGFIERNQFAPGAFSVRLAVDRTLRVSGHVGDAPSMLSWIHFDLGRDFRFGK